jgi:hypothetical protein
MLFQQEPCAQAVFSNQLSQPLVRVLVLVLVLDLDLVLVLVLVLALVLALALVLVLVRALPINPADQATLLPVPFWIFLLMLPLALTVHPLLVWSRFRSSVVLIKKSKSEDLFTEIQLRVNPPVRLQITNKNKVPWAVYRRKKQKANTGMY